MKQVFIIGAILLIATTIYAQGVTVTPAVRVRYMNSSYLWMPDTTKANTDTVTVTTSKVTGVFTAPLGYVNLSYTGVMAAGSDSLIAIIYGSNTQWTIYPDTLVSSALDSTKIKASGFGSYVFNLAGKFKPTLFLKFHKLGSATGAKLTRVSVGTE